MFFLFCVQITFVRYNQQYSFVIKNKMILGYCVTNQRWWKSEAWGNQLHKGRQIPIFRNVSDSEMIELSTPCMGLVSLRNISLIILRKRF